MSWIEENYEMCKIGFDGESCVRQWFKSINIDFMQVDIMFNKNDKWYLGEIKTQEKFKAPPFDGHGMPEWQINRRIKFYNDTGIEPYLIVKDKDESCLYIGSIIELMKKDKIITRGKKPRVVFNLINFTKIIL